MRLPTLPSLRRATGSAGDAPSDEAPPAATSPEAEAADPAAARSSPDRSATPDPARRMRRIAAILAVATLLTAGIGGYVWHRQDAAAERSEAARSCVAQAGTAAQAIFSYDYRSFEASVADGSRYTTGQFAGEYVKMTASLKPLATSEQAIVRAQVSAIGVEDVSGDTVTVLVYLNQYRRNAKISGEKVDQNRVVLTLRRTDGGWKVAAAAAV
jgi:Mce-associated membrane protein